MRRTDIVKMIRPLQLALALVPLVAFLLSWSVTHAGTRTLTDARDATTQVSAGR